MSVCFLQRSETHSVGTRFDRSVIVPIYDDQQGETQKEIPRIPQRWPKFGNIFSGLKGLFSNFLSI